MYGFVVLECGVVVIYVVGGVDLVFVDVLIENVVFDGWF